MNDTIARTSEQSEGEVWRRELDKNLWRKAGACYWERGRPRSQQQVAALIPKLRLSQ